MMKRLLPVLLFFSLILVFIPFGSEAHAPVFPSSNDSLASAHDIDDPSKSWVIYNHLDQHSVHYYRFQLQDQRLLMQILVPVHEAEGGFQPNLVLMIPDYADGPSLPSYIAAPPGYGYEVLVATLPETVDYEGITATAFYVVIDFDESSSELYDGLGNFYVAVYDANGDAGNYAFVLGYKESFTLSELALVPFSFIGIYLWQGSGLFLLAMPLAIALLGGISLMFYLHRRGSLDLPRALALTGGSLMIGTALLVTLQMLYALNLSGFSSHAVTTLLLVSMSAAAGILAVLQALSPRIGSRSWRALTSFAAILALVSWGGLIIGPAMVMVAALSASRKDSDIE